MRVNARIGGLILSVSFCLALVLSCKDDPVIVDGFAFTISGTVYDSVTSLPIDSAPVTWGDTVDSRTV